MKAVAILAVLLVLQNVSALPAQVPTKDNDNKDVSKDVDTDDVLMKVMEVISGLGGMGVKGSNSSSSTSNSVFNQISSTLGTGVVAIQGDIHFEIDGFDGKL